MLTIEVDDTHTISGLLQVPEHATACLVLAHGAGAGMNHAFMTAVADGLFDRRVATLRYQFPYMETGSKRPDRPALAQATVRAAVDTAAQLTRLPLFAGGKSFGGRMTSQAQAMAPLRDIRGLVFIGFPLHPAKKPATEHAEHLKDVTTPMLFVQGLRDALADMALLGPIIGQLGARATLVPIEGADHSFHVPARSGRTDAEVLESILDTVAGWLGRLVDTP